MRILLIDNFDSFTYNLVEEFKVPGHEVLIYRNDIPAQVLADILDEFKPGLIVLSPGPSTPNEAGICVSLIQNYQRDFPILGICLGHQCLISAFGGRITRCTPPFHGKKSAVTHVGGPLWKGIPNPFSAGRYHSLYGAEIPSRLEVTAWVGDIPMAVTDRDYPLYGLQFHPESLLTTYGSRILHNILETVDELSSPARESESPD